MVIKSQEKNKRCIVCNKKVKKYLLCDRCKNNPFRIEDARSKAAILKEKLLFRDLYRSSYPSIKNLNSRHFWDKHFHKELTLTDQDQMTKEKIKKIASLIPNKKSMLLDLGFGQGYLEEELETQQKVISLFGIDISKRAVKKARNRFAGTFTEGDILKLEKLPYRKSYFKIVTAIEVVEHIPPGEILQFYKNVHSILKKNGILIISTPLNEHLEHSRNNPSGHVRAYTKDIIKAELELTGFKVKKMFTFYAFNKFYRVKKLLVLFLKDRWEPNNVVVYAQKTMP